ncbi:MAG: type II toxin-antitoxin system RelE family toxin [Gemmatimonadaceae bacterium]
MASYSLQIKRSAAKELAQLPTKDRRRVIARIQSLADEPRPSGAEKLSGQERYRVHQGDYRILYEIEDQVLRILVVKIGHRRNVYRRNL